MFKSPAEIAFNIFGFPVYFYGITLALAILAGIYASYYIYKKFYNTENNAEKIIDFSPYIIIIGIVGARLYYCLVNYSYYISHPLEIFYVRQGGLSIHGMIILGVLSLFMFAKIYKMSFLKLFDVFMCGTALAQSIGRWGNFFNSEAFGLPADVLWKLYIPVSKRPPEFINYEYFHPTFLYESILDFVIFIILLLIFKRFINKPGVVACIYLILYSFARIYVEHIRIDSALNIHGFPVAQLTSVGIILFAAIFMTILFIREK